MAMNIDVEQWASNVVSFSSEYSASWAATCILGPPRVYPKYGDIAGAWAHRQARSNTEYIELEFEELIYIKEVNIYETYNAGAVIRISAKAPDGSWFDLYKLESRPNPIHNSRIFVPEIRKTNFKTKTLKIVMDCEPAGDWCELDAVMIKGSRIEAEAPPPLSALADDMSSLVNSDFFSDVVLDVGGQKFHCHRAILAARSSYFKAMFCDGLKESMLIQNKAVKIEDIKSEPFLNVLQYLYTNDIKPDISHPDLIELTRVADRFSIDGLFKLGNQKLCSIINTSNVVAIFREATEQLPVLDVVSETCIDYISYHMAEVSKQADFAALPQDIMLDIIQKSTAKLSLK